MGRTIIIGAGIAGLSASYSLQKKNKISLVIEKKDEYGGLCNSFCIDGFVFDTFAHISFDNEPYTYSILEGKTDHLTHKPEALNYCDGYWVRNPVQNNLVGLPVAERMRIIESYLKRPHLETPQNYAEWLDTHFGDYFASHYPKRYTRKYWTVEADILESNWIQGRMTTPCLKEMLRGSIKENRKICHYSGEARYPVNGGFKSFLDPLASGADILYNTTVTEIDSMRRRINLSNGSELEYESIISTIPLTELVGIIKDVPDEIVEYSLMLDHTSGVIVSLGINKPHISPSLWFYIYDEDIYPARVYSPDWKSPNNVPDGCSAIQAEVYFSKYRPLEQSLEELKEYVIEQLFKLKLFKQEDIIVSDIRYIEYANVMFTPQIYEARDNIHRYLDSIGIGYAGRWGEWDYLWVGQSMRSGKKAAEKVSFI